MNDGIKQWWERFTTWVRHEPVRASEAVRALLFALTAVLAATGVEVEATAVSGAVTAVFSIYASKTVRNKVSPLSKLEAEDKVFVSESKAAAYEEAVNGAAEDDEIPV